MSRNEISCKSVKSIIPYSRIADLLYVFQFSSTYELQDGEYIELPIYCETFEEDFNLKAIVEETENELEINKTTEDYWTLYITEYGTIIITVIL